MLNVAAHLGHLEVLKILLPLLPLSGAGAVDDVSPGGRTALHYAAESGKVGIIDALVGAGATLEMNDGFGLTPLHLAAQGDFKGAVRALLGHGATMNALDNDGRTPLHVAAESGQLAAVKELLAADADYRISYSELDLSALDGAACGGHVAVVKELIEHGMDVDGLPSFGARSTPLHHAAWKNQVGAIDTLVEAGANVGAQNNEGGCTPLHFACEALSREALVALHKHGAKVNAKDLPSHCEPPLHFAAQQGGKNGATCIVDLLLRWGADETAVDDNGFTAAEVVGADVHEEEDRREEGICAIRELLANASADRAWRRRGPLMMCISRVKTTTNNITSIIMGKQLENGQPAMNSGGPGVVTEGGSVRSGTTSSPLVCGNTGTNGEGMKTSGSSRRGIEKKKKKKKANSGDKGQGTSRDFADLVAWLLEAEDAGLFRTIVAFI